VGKKQKQKTAFNEIEMIYDVDLSDHLSKQEKKNKTNLFIVYILIEKLAPALCRHFWKGHTGDKKCDLKSGSQTT
jgi:hypothetical protein